MKHSPGFLQMVEKARQSIPEKTVDQCAQEIISNKKSYQLFDVREDSEWQAGHLPNSQHLSKGIIERDIESRVPDKSTPIVLYCGGGYRSLLAGKALQEMGYKNVWSLAGGWREWNDKKLPTER